MTGAATLHQLIAILRSARRTATTPTTATVSGESAAAAAADHGQKMSENTNDTNVSSAVGRRSTVTVVLVEPSPRYDRIDRAISWISMDFMQFGSWPKEY
jgi:inner membrane protein involved in colicin E2 resistance